MSHCRSWEPWPLWLLRSTVGLDKFGLLPSEDSNTDGEDVHSPMLVYRQHQPRDNLRVSWNLAVKRNLPVQFCTHSFAHRASFASPALNVRLITRILQWPSLWLVMPKFCSPKISVPSRCQSVTSICSLKCTLRSSSLGQSFSISMAPFCLKLSRALLCGAILLCTWRVAHCMATLYL